jgi:hypothetical protein
MTSIEGFDMGGRRVEGRTEAHEELNYSQLRVSIKGTNKSPPLP